MAQKDSELECLPDRIGETIELAPDQIRNALDGQHGLIVPGGLTPGRVGRSVRDIRLNLFEQLDGKVRITGCPFIYNVGEDPLPFGAEPRRVRDELQHGFLAEVVDLEDRKTVPELIGTYVRSRGSRNVVLAFLCLICLAVRTVSPLEVFIVIAAFDFLLALVSFIWLRIVLRDEIT